jgi:hypothetical protein
MWITFMFTSIGLYMGVSPFSCAEIRLGLYPSNVECDSKLYIIQAAMRINITEAVLVFEFTPP